jgi:outer membrane cobalamin receptor
VIALGAGTAAHAGPITGRIVDPDGGAVPHARVLLVRGSVVIDSTSTDASGGFTMKAPDDGRLEVRVAADGFRAEPLILTGEPRARDLGTIALAVSAVTESVIVSAAQADIPLTTTSAAVTVMTGAELAARQIDGLPDALRLVPGLTVASSGSRGAVTSVFPRGGESDYALVLIDGVPANAFGGGFDFADVPLVNIDRIEVVRGPQSALYGSNAIGAVVRVVTKRGGPPGGSASLEGGSFDTVRAAAATTGSAGPLQWGASAERFASDGMNGGRTAAGETIVNDGYERRALAASGGWTGGAGAALGAAVQYITDERGAPGPFGSNPGGFFEGIDAVSHGTDDRWLSSISAQTSSGRRLRAVGQVMHGRIDGTFVSPFGTSESWSRRTTARAQGDIVLHAAVDASVGAELQRERAGGTFITAAGSREVPVERALTGVFGEVRWNHHARLFVTAGVRADQIARSALPGNPDAFAPRPDFDEDTLISTNPKVAAAWFLRSTAAGHTKLRISAGTGIRPPDAFEIAFTDNPSLQPERSRSVDFGLDQTLAGGRGVVEATAFFNEYDDLIVAVGSFNGSSRYRTDNISNARARGLELAAGARMRWTMRVPVDVRLRAGYTFLDTEILAVDRASAAPPPFVPGDPLLRRPRHVFSVDAAFEAGRVSGFLRGGGRSRVLDVEPSLGTFGGLFDAPGFSVWNMGLAWTIFDRLQLFGRLNNIFDRDYEEVLGFPAPPRAAFAGIRVAAGG